MYVDWLDAPLKRVTGADVPMPYAANLEALALPQGVKDAIGRRLDALSNECNEMLRAAAVLGRLLARTPGSAEAHEILGLVRLRQRLWEDARKASLRRTSNRSMLAAGPG